MKRAFAFLAVSTALWTLAAGAQSRDPVALPLDATLGAPQGADDVVAYAFDAAPGETYLIEVEQQGLDFIVVVKSPDGSSRSYDSPLKRDAMELVLLEDAAAGSYQIVVRSDEPTSANGRHEIRRTRVDPTSTAVPAWRLMSEGAAANADGSRAAAQDALAAYQRAADLWQSLGNGRMRAQALYSVAMLEYWVMYDWSRAGQLAGEIGSSYDALGEPALQANAAFLEGLAVIEQANELEGDEAQVRFRAALAQLDRARALYESMDNVYGVAHVANNVGLTYFYMGDFQTARAYWEKSAPLFKSIGEWREELQVMQNLAVINVEEGYSGRAIEVLRGIIAGIPDGKDPEFRATVLENLGAAEREFGNVDEALRAYSAALEIRRRLDDRIGEGYSLRGLGSTYYAFGEFDLASQYLQEALANAREANDGRTQAIILTDLGSIEFLKQDYDSALERHRAALEITNSRPGRAYRLVLVAKDLSALGRTAEALASATEALSIAEGVDSQVTVADALQEMGVAYARNHDRSNAITSLNRALKIYDSLGLEAGQAAVLDHLALAARDGGSLDDAVRYSAAALDHVESLRDRVAAPELRAVYSARRGDYYERHVELLMARQLLSVADDRDLRAAFATSERGRARMMVDLLSETSRRAAQDGDGARETELYEELAALRYQRDRLLEQSNADGEESLRRVLNSMASVENELNLLETDARSHAAGDVLAPPDPLTAAQVQQLLDRDSVLLQYALGDERSFVWVVTAESIRAIELADRDTIETSARRVYERLRTSPPVPATDLNRELRALSRLVVDPVIEVAAGRRLLLALDGALQYIPFAVLPLEVDGQSQPLAATREIVGIPSMSALAAQRARHRLGLPSKALAVFADPVFEESDPRIARTDAVQPAILPWTSLIVRSSAGATLDRLVASGYEAEAIAGLVPLEDRLIASGFAANRHNVLQQDLGQYRFLHFATHGLLDSRYPALSALALSQYDEGGRAQEGFLNVRDIYGLELNADVVVLSACETALGREIRGEGLLGLTQGFMYAGAKSLVVSLWKVSDRATAELMTRFYAHMFRDGQSPAEALRNAQVSIASERRWSHPYYWGAFVLIGDWQPGGD
jgi:CHAT domain-containing protein/tetratricopeptide (TPR) repeat protein